METNKTERRAGLAPDGTITTAAYAIDGRGNIRVWWAVKRRGEAKFADLETIATFPDTRRGLDKAIALCERLHAEIRKPDGWKAR